MADLSVRVAVPGDLLYLDHLQLTHRSQLGFLPRVAQLGYLTTRRVLLLAVNDSPAGFLLWRKTRHPDPRLTRLGLQIVQICVEPGLRRLLHATLLLDSLESQPALARSTYTRCWCASDLPANGFWSALGFRNDLTRDSTQAGRTLRTHHHWTRTRA